jgi:hypothetical protein
MIKILIALSLPLLLIECTTCYVCHIKTIPDGEYQVFLNGELQGNTLPNGDTTIETGPVSVYKKQVVELAKDTLRAKLVMDYSGNTNERENVVKASSSVKSHQEYQVLFQLGDATPDELAGENKPFEKNADIDNLKDASTSPNSKDYPLTEDEKKRTWRVINGVSSVVSIAILIITLMSMTRLR